MNLKTIMHASGARQLPALVSGILLLAGGAHTAGAQPDLVINVADSYIQAGGCDESSDLATGRIAIKNIGSSQAKMKNIERFTRSMLVVYVPENVGMIDKKTKSESLDVFDQESINFAVGSDIAKRGRFFGTPPTTVGTANLPRNADGRTVAIQKALNELGHDAGPVDGIIGRQTREAINRYQKSKGEAVTRTLTAQQRGRLLEEAGVRPQSNAYTGAQGRIAVTLYAAVDPYDLVEESNEANNVVKFTVEIDCSQ